MSAGDYAFYLFALGFHVFGSFIAGGLYGEFGDANGNWDHSVPCYRGGDGGAFTDKDGDWFTYTVDNSNAVVATALDSPPACNNEATAELIMIATGTSFVLLDTAVTIFSWITIGLGFMNWPDESDGKAFKLWKDNSGNMADQARKMIRMMSIFGAYFSAFLWACGYTASFNSRPQSHVSADGVTMHEDNWAFANSGFFVAAMIAILVTILPRADDAGYSFVRDS
jgi:hypothetical protein